MMKRIMITLMKKMKLKLMMVKLKFRWKESSSILLNSAESNSIYKMQMVSRL